MKNGSKIVLGILLIFLGGVFLAENLGYEAVEVVWDWVAKLWPSIIIYVGISRLYRGLRLKNEK